MHKRLSARTTAVLTTLLLSASVVLGTASPAAAHDDFVSSYPTADSTINGSPDEISLMFTGTLTGGDDATVVEVIDESGANVAVDPPTVSGDSINQHLSPDAATGIFTVRWNTVSADGHPISGEYVYTVTPAMDTEPSTPTTSPTPETSPTEEPEPARPAQTYGGTASGGGAFELLPLFFLSGLALILGIGVVGVAMAGRQRHQRDRAQAAKDAAATENDADA